MPALSTATNGQLYFAPVASWETMDSLLAADIESMTNLSNSKSMSLWEPSAPVFYGADKFRKLTSTGSSKFKVMPVDNYDDSATDEVQGWLAYTVWGYANYTDVVGQLKISYNITWNTPKEAADGAATSQHLVSTGSGLAASVTALNADRFGHLPCITLSEPVTGTIRYTFNRKGNYLIAGFITGATLTVGLPASVAGMGRGDVARDVNHSTSAVHHHTYWVTASAGYAFDVAITNHANITAWHMDVSSARRACVAWLAAL